MRIINSGHEENNQLIEYEYFLLIADIFTLYAHTVGKIFEQKFVVHSRGLKKN